VAHPVPESRLVSPEVHCAHLRHKGMYVLSTPDPGEQQHAGTWDATAYWCTQTQKAMGPDGSAANASCCVAGNGRGCCH
jgi:hypothetical protein